MKVIDEGKAAVELIKHNCFVCGSESFFLEFSGRLTNDHKFFRCASCGVIIAEAERKKDMDYSDYGDYLIEEQSWETHLAKAKKNHSVKLRALSSENKKTLLDFGAGEGFFVKAARDMGFEAVGYDPSDKLRTFASQTLGATLFSDLQMIDGTFDVISMFDVIEHIPAYAQREVMSSLVKKLNTGGVLIGNTPNFESANTWIRKESDPAIWPPSHCSYFSPYSLNAYLESLELVKVSLYTQGVRSFRANKDSLSFLEKNTASTLFKWSCIYPMKVILRMLSLALSPVGFGYQIYFSYRKR